MKNKLLSIISAFCLALGATGAQADMITDAQGNVATIPLLNVMLLSAMVLPVFTNLSHTNRPCCARAKKAYNKPN